MEGTKRHWRTIVGTAVLSLLLSLSASDANEVGAVDETCGPVASWKWGVLSKQNILVVAGAARAVFCRGISLSFDGPMGTIGVAPDAIMPSRAAASFIADLAFIATNFIPENEQIATPKGQFPFRVVPDLSNVTEGSTQIGIRRSDGQANTIFFKLSDGRIAFFVVRKVEGFSFGDLVPLGSYFFADTLP